MRLVILGGSGAGKGTQAQKLGQRLNLPVLSTGDVIRAAIATQAAADSESSASEDSVSKNLVESAQPTDPELVKLAQAAKPYLEQGKLVPDELMIGFIRQRLLQLDMQQGWVLEGYPRTAFQAEELDFLLEELGQSIRYAIWLDVPQETLIERALARSRADDDLDNMKRRIQSLEEYTKPLQDYYGYRKRLLLIDGARSPEAVEADLIQQLPSEIRSTSP